MKKQKIVMCRPDYFGVNYEINPWMEGQIGRVNRDLARDQWNYLYKTLAQYVDIHCIPAQEDMPDLVFTANGGLSLGENMILSRFRLTERQAEESIFYDEFNKLHYQLSDFGRSLSFEGEGDALFQANERLLWAAYGVRSCLEVQLHIMKSWQIEVIPLRLIDPRFYHLDTCFAPLSAGEALYFPNAFDAFSLSEIEQRISPANRILVSEEDACQFACNLFNIKEHIFTNAMSPELIEKLNDRGYQIHICAVSEFMKAGGGVKCLTMKLEQQNIVAASPSANLQSTICTAHLKLSGHLLDSGELSEILNCLDRGGLSFELIKLVPALRTDQASHAKLKICAPNQVRMDAVLKELLGQGVELMTASLQAQFAPSPKDGVAPENFYSTSIYPTQVLCGSQWLELQNRRMDGVIILSADQQQISCQVLRDIKEGDQILIGDQGLKVDKPITPDQNTESFSFMSSGVSSERRVEGQIEALANEMKKLKTAGAKIAVVAGPVVVHTGAGIYLEQMIRAGFIDTLLTGNALAVHDIEYNLFGTSLGVDLQKGQAIAGGHQHHLRAINQIRLAGSIEEAVKQKVIKSGIMHACVQNKVDYILAGSIRDDGPLPDAIMDLIVAQERYAEAIKDCKMILMLSTMLHSIGVGNMTPSEVQLICVDINPAVVSKLADRGSLEAVGIVTDVGLFLQRLASALEV
ncbi:TIGR00300 family protein [Lentisphaera profundi]|uniref:ornithine cyclodeaminase n=1 Tax=Lentisphaera profundi TaxID=1658616 RepID=A0ABY7W2K7_9BACT|nr:TIGR00300 family protein [Lentisphaera profundi]WDE98518.1 TIGR00300 family protein [Lentisphaera profundi]